MDMYNANKSCEEIVLRLKTDFGVHYDPKSIVGRFRRLELVRAQAEEDVNFDIWILGDVCHLDSEKALELTSDQDEALLAACRQAETVIQARIKNVEAQRWNIVANLLKRNLRREEYTYSAKRCEKRYNDLANGCASPAVDATEEEVVVMQQESQALGLKIKAEVIAKRDAELKERKTEQAKKRALVTQTKAERAAARLEANKVKIERHKAGLEKAEMELSRSKNTLLSMQARRER